MPRPTLPQGYSLREATIDDLPVIVRHRLSMFRDMGVPQDEPRTIETFTLWLGEMLPAGIYRGWLVEDGSGDVAAGGGITVLPWPPGPRSFTGRMPIVYNVYTEPAHRRRGLARAVMLALEGWCRDHGHTVIGLAASVDGRALYDALGYEPAPQPYLFKALS